MKINPKNMPEKAALLSKAWLEFADYPEQFGSRRKRYLEIVKANALKPDIDEHSRLNPVNIQADKLQCELLSEIREGTFNVWGRDAAKGVNSPPIALLNSYFDETREFFKVDWNNDIVEIHGNKFFDVRVAPAITSAVQPDAGSTKIGRPSPKGIEEAIEALDNRDPTFRKSGRKRQCELVRLEIHGPNVDQNNPPKNYGDGAINDRLRKYFPS